jgi:hypothetical protein
VNALAAIMAREGKIRATNLIFIFWDLVYPLGYLLVFGVGINASLGFTVGCGLQRVLPGRRAVDGELRDCREHVVVVLSRP